jgi:hypothetical protein
VAGQGEGGRSVRKFRVAIIATIEMGSARKLLLVGVLVAVGATVKLYLVPRSLAGGSMALCARYVGMFAPQWESRQVVLYQEELCGLEALDRVTGFAFATVSALRELSTVRIWFMAIGTLIKRQRLLEIPFHVALNATYILVFAEQRILGSRMIELSFH